LRRHFSMWLTALSISDSSCYTSRMNADTLEQIQTKIAFLERAASELSDMVFRQHQEIQVLEAKVKALSDRLISRQSDENAGMPEQERPPHY
jgi:SlyX protein